MSRTIVLACTPAVETTSARSESSTLTDSLRIKLACDDQLFAHRSCLLELFSRLRRFVCRQLCFDYPSAAVQEVCLRAYDPARAKGHKPVVNSLAETRQEMLELVKICPFQVILMASERLEDGSPKSNKLTSEVLGVARRVTSRLNRE